MSTYLVRDENSEPVRTWITRDPDGRFRTPLLTFVWADDPDLTTDRENS